MLLCALACRRAVAPTVLLVEDHADTRLMYAEYLRPDYETSEAGTAWPHWSRCAMSCPT